MEEFDIIPDLSDESVIDLIWDKAQKVEGFNESIYRKDSAGAWIMRSMYGKQADLGWEIDHVFPVSKGGENHFVNLRPMHWQNNQSKRDSYPSYLSTITSEGNKNVQKVEVRTINGGLQEKLNNIYNA